MGEGEGEDGSGLIDLWEVAGFVEAYKLPMHLALSSHKMLGANFSSLFSGRFEGMVSAGDFTSPPLHAILLSYVYTRVGSLTSFSREKAEHKHSHSRSANLRMRLAIRTLHDRFELDAEFARVRRTDDRVAIIVALRRKHVGILRALHCWERVSAW